MHAQVLTPPALAKRLVETVAGTGKSWLELGSGTGRIAEACLSYKNPASYFGVEVDAELLRNCKKAASTHYAQINVMDPEALQTALGARLFDVVGGNPPYGMAELSGAAEARLAALCPGLPQAKGWGQLDLYFVLESLARLKKPGEAAFIVGAALAEDARLEAFRKALVEAATEVECYELPLNIFEGDIEVQSYLLIARFGHAGKCKVTVGRMEGDSLAIVKQRKISPKAASVRLDLSYHEFLELDFSLRRMRGCSTLKELGGSIVRGSRTKNQFLNLGISHFHTSDFPRNGVELHFEHDPERGYQLAQQGDILIPRVGSRCLDRQAIVVDGCRPYTEAVYRLRLPYLNRDHVLAWVGSEVGTSWRRAIAKGSCAKHLTVTALLNMPVPARQ